jgi:Protein of unknown function (DUF2971)
VSGDNPQKELEDFLSNDLRAELWGEVPLVGFYHYTTTTKLTSILESKTIRAGCIEKMNDTSEIRFAASIFRALVDRRYATEPDPETVDFLQAVRCHLQQPLDVSHIFALSLSVGGDEAGMWSLYADRGQGFSFCISTKDIIPWAGFNEKGWFWKCKYGEEETTRYCQKILDKGIAIHREHSRHASAYDVDTYAAMFVDRASYLAPVFKPKIWHDEQEWRWIFVRPDKRGKPYIELPLYDSSGENCVISAICAGPNTDYLRSTVPLLQLFARMSRTIPVHVSQHRVDIPGFMPAVLLESVPHAPKDQRQDEFRSNQFNVVIPSPLPP